MQTNGWISSIVERNVKQRDDSLRRRVFQTLDTTSELEACTSCKTANRGTRGRRLASAEGGRLPTAPLWRSAAIRSRRAGAARELCGELGPMAV